MTQSKFSSIIKIALLQRLHSSLVILIIINIGSSRGIESVQPLYKTGLPLVVGQLLEVVPGTKESN
jgi:hypothetical protein